MGVADRAYMRGTGPGQAGPMRSWTVRALVLLAVVFVAGKGSRGWFGVEIERHLDLSIAALRAGRVWTVFTSALVHADVMHLLMNGIGLWFFGRMVEETLGAARYAMFLLLAAVLTHVPFLAVELATHGSTATIGASGVVMAAIVFAAFRHPGAPVYVFFLPLKLWQLAVLYVGFDLYGLLTREGRIDHWTHLGGVAFGFLVHRYGLVPELRVPRLATPKREPGPFAQGNVRTEIDRLLDKINAQGIGSLSESEREFLKRNSGRYD